MGMSTSHKRWTAAEIDALPADGNRYEVIDGERFVTPGPAMVHQRAVLQLAALLLPYCEACGIELMIAPADVKFGDDDQVQPDLFVMPRTADGSSPERFTDVGRLLLAVEVVSESSRRTDRGRKRRLYQAQRVPEYWVIDVDARVVEKWTVDAAREETLSDVLSWQPLAETEADVIDLVAYFRRVCGW